MPDQAHKYETNYASSRTSNLLFVWEITLTCTKRLLKDMSDIFRNKHSSRSIYLTPKTTPRVTVWNTEDCCHICENQILPWRLRLIDANASQFPALQCHKMKISQPGEQINSELCHAIFVGHYIWFLFIPVEMSPVGATKPSERTSWLRSLQPKVTKYIRVESSRPPATELYMLYI